MAGNFSLKLVSLRYNIFNRIWCVLHYVCLLESLGVKYIMLLHCLIFLSNKFNIKAVKEGVTFNFYSEPLCLQRKRNPSCILIWSCQISPISLALCGFHTIIQALVVNTFLKLYVYTSLWRRLPHYLFTLLVSILLDNDSIWIICPKYDGFWGLILDNWNLWDFILMFCTFDCHLRPDR